MGRVQAWRLAVRPPTLTAAMAPVAAGTGLAIGRGAFDAGPALAALFGAVCLQVGANLANDVFDHERGADTADRLGPPRVTQLGLLRPRQVKAGMWASFALAMAAGVYLTAVAGWPIVAVGLASIVAAIVYTGGPWPVGYHALGDLFTFVFFGLVAVAGTYYVQAEELPWEAAWAGVPLGCAITAILAVNNLRDIETDRRAGKVTLGVVLGDRATRRWYLFLLAAGVGSAVASWPLGLAGPPGLLALLSLVVAAPPARAVASGATGRALNPCLKATARFSLALGVCFGVALAI